MVVVNVDFTDVDSSSFLAPGTYRAKVAAVEQRDGSNYPGLKWTWESIEPETAGQKSDMFLSLAPKALWKLKNTIEALGRAVPKSALKINTDQFIGKVATITVIDEPWTDAEGKLHHSSKIDTVFRATPENAPETAKQEPEPEEAPPADYSDIDFGGGDGDDIPF
jgi:hypothetical protein